ncbi:MAG: indole-3-glycerol phosphate synthase TrpC [Thermodesulfobacteriota bacterium]
MATDERHTPDILSEIVAHQRDVIDDARRRRTIDELRRDPGYAAPRRSLIAALRARRPAVIAECKRRSPSKGVLRDPYDPVAIARGYAASGAAAISVLTNERYFGGTLEHLKAVRAAVSVPVLRKDFVIDAYQLEEARAAGADAVLLIAATLPPVILRELHRVARDLGLEVLVEVHDEMEVRHAIGAEARIIGINNRNLRTFVTDLATSERLAGLLPQQAVVVAESGLRDGRDLARLGRAGIGAFLVGEALMTAPDPGAALHEMLRQAAEVA